MRAGIRAFTRKKTAEGEKIPRCFLHAVGSRTPYGSLSGAGADHQLLFAAKSFFDFSIAFVTTFSIFASVDAIVPPLRRAFDT